MNNNINKLIITRKENRIYYGYFCDGQPVELYCETADSQDSTLLGNIYAARVERVAEGIGGAFLEIGPGQKCYYPLPKDGSKPVKLSPGHEDKLYGGDIILVQISKDAVKSKLPVADGNISFAGKYFVLTLSDRRFGISKKITDGEERKRLKKIVAYHYNNLLNNRCAPDVDESGYLDIWDMDDLAVEGTSCIDMMQKRQFGLIVRTNAAGASEEELIKELTQLTSRCSRLLKKASTAPGKTCIYRTPDHYISMAADLPKQELGEILTDDPEIYKDLRDYYSSIGDETIEGKLRLYEDQYPLHKLYCLKTHYERALNKHVWLPSGGSLVIEQTEAMVVIDVNTGSVTKKKRQNDDLFYQINCEAAEEIGRQLRLRNLSGIIVIDFINMRYIDQQQKLLKKLQEVCSKDRVRTRVIDITALNLVEMTRQKVRRPLHEQCSEIPVT
ncbi:MAG: ribonuclease E/G [Eubacterium sp.]|nr:ribonuclease E/G [Eubacterium sp.]